MLTFSIDTTEFEAKAKKAIDQLERELAVDGYDAANAGVSAAKATHPYTDRTHDLTDEANVQYNYVEGGGLMTWPMPYASFVDRGTSRAKPYPFTPLAESVAKSVLERKTKQSVERFTNKFGR